jgi:adhesin/invasin
MNQANAHWIFQRLFLVFALAGLATICVLMAGANPAQADDVRVINIVVNPSTLTADGASTATITVTVWNSDTLLLPAEGVMLTGYLSPSSLGEITTFGPTNSQGQAVSIWTAGTVAGSGQLVIGDGNVTGTASITLTTGPLETIAVSPSSVAVSAGTTYTFTATGYDHYANVVVLAPTWTTNGGLINSSSGVFTAQTSVATGRWVMATQSGISGSAAVDIIAGVPYTITLSANPGSLAVGTSTSVEATVVDQFNNPVANGTVVTFATSLGSASPLTNTTKYGIGLATSSISSIQAGLAHITATGGTAQGFTTVIFLPGPPSTLTLQATPSSQVVGNGSVLTATVRDQHGNLVESGLSVTFNTNLGGVVSPGTITDGIATSSISSTLAGTAHVTATCLGAQGSTPVTFTAGAPYTITLSPGTGSLVVGSSISLTAIITDTYGNRVPGALVTFESSIGNMPPSATTNNNGVALSSMYSEQRGTAYITATSESRHGYATVTFNPDGPDWLTLEAWPTTQVVGSNSVVTATVYDRFSNLVADNTPVAFSVDQPGTILSPGMTTDGVATSRVTVTLASLATVTASSGNAESSTTINFTPGAVMTITVVVNPPNLIANSSATAAITATAIDRYRNPVPGIVLTGATEPSSLGTVSSLSATNAKGRAFGTWTAGTTVGNGRLRVSYNSAVSGTANITLAYTNPQTVTVQVISSTLFANSGMSTTVTAIVSDTYGNLFPGATLYFSLSPEELGSVTPYVTTDGNGRASNTWTAGTFIGSGHLTASAGDSVSDSATITLTVNAPYTLTLQAGSISPVAGIGAVVTATVSDRFHNPVVNGTVVTFTSDFGTVRSPVTTTNGAASSWISGTLVGMVHITATSGSARDSMVVNFVPDVPAIVTLQPSPTSLVVGNSSVLTATVVDRFGHYVANGTAVTITTDVGYIRSPVTTTNGIATSVISSTQAGAAYITATSGLAQGFTTVTFTPEAPLTVDLQASPASQVVGNSSVLTATVRDRYSNLVASGFLVTFITDLGSVISPGATLDGVATSSIFARQVGTAHIIATCESISGTAVVSFVPDVSSELLLQAAPPLQIVGNSSVLTATVRDQYGNLVANGTVVSLTSSLGSVISPVTTTNGIATSSVSSTLPGIASIVATSGVAQGTASATFVPDASSTTTSVQLGTDILIVNSNTTTPITATVFDFYNNPVPGVTVTGYLSPTTLGDLTWQNPTDANGVVSGFWTAGTVPGSGMLVVGNSSITVSLAPKRIFLPVMMRGFPPTPVSKSLKINGGAEITYQITVTLEVSATIQSDYVEWMRFSNDGTHWSDWLAYGLTTTWKLTSSNGLAVVYAQFKGHKGGISAVTSDDIFLFKNGDFSQPNLMDWIQDPNSHLSVSRSTDPARPSNPAGLLGSTAYGCNGVPIGYVSLSQPFVVPTMPAGKGLVLEFSYHIYTYDRNILLDDKGDRFDVLFDGIRVLRDMNQTLQYQCSTVHDLGRKTVSIPVVGNPGDSINVTLLLYNWPDQLYNTYVYLDDVHPRYISLMRTLSSR